MVVTPSRVMDQSLLPLALAGGDGSGHAMSSGRSLGASIGLAIARDESLLLRYLRHRSIATLGPL